MTAYPDVEALLTSAVADYEATVTQIGGTSGRANAQHQVLIQLDVFADSKKVARDDAYSALENVLACQRTNPEIAGKIVLTQAPQWLPDPDGKPRYVATVTATTRTNRDVTYPR